jgi:restriction system protein
MERYNPDSPWNPARPVEISPEEYELQVVGWLRASAPKLASFIVHHRHPLGGPGGEYTFDAVATFTILNNAQLVVLVECKRLSRPVEREELLALYAKLQEVGAHKAMVFATCGFQSGALDFARAHGIATVIFVAGDFLYMTKGMGRSAAPPPWANLPRFQGIFVSREGSTVHSTTVNHERCDALRNWVQAPGPGV